MATVRAVYCRSNTLGSLALCIAQWSRWSHVATVVPGYDDVVIEAHFPSGVRVRSLKDLIAASSAYEFREWEVPDARGGAAWLIEQLGKPYDWLGVLGLGLHRDWQSDDAWWCSELHERFLQECGRLRFVHEPRRVTVEHSWMVA